MEINKIIEEFLSTLDSKISKNILTIIAYGSRVLNTNNKNSDLDVLIISKGPNNFRVGSVVEGIKIDCTIYGINNIYDIMYHNTISNNSYFNSVLSHGYIIKDSDVIPIIHNYLNELSEIKLPKRIVPPSMIDELSELYYTYLTSPNDYNYYLLLEKIRTTYHYKNRYSHLSLAKVLEIYQNPAKYQENYQISLPPKPFISTYLTSLSILTTPDRKQILDKLLNILNIPLTPSSTKLRNDEDSFLTTDEIKRYLLKYYNRINYLQSLSSQKPYYFNYIYYVTLSQLIELSEKIKVNIPHNIDITESNSSKVKFLYHLLVIIGADYHFDYEQYVLKLK